MFSLDSFYSYENDSSTNESLYPLAMPVGLILFLGLSFLLEAGTTWESLSLAAIGFHGLGDRKQSDGGRAGLRAYLGLVNHLFTPIAILDEKGSILSHNDAFLDAAQLDKNIPVVDRIFSAPLLRDLGEEWWLDCLSVLEESEEYFHVVKKNDSDDTFKIRLFKIGNHDDYERPLIGCEILFLSGEDAQAEGVTAHQTEFLAEISHELRTPLNGIVGMSDLLSETQLDEEQQEYIDIIQKSSGTLLNIINGVIDYSRINAVDIQLREIEMNLRDSIDHCINLVSHDAEEKDLEVTLDMGHDVPQTILSDETRFQQILSNLLGNAIKFTDKGQIDIRVYSKRRTRGHFDLFMVVSDTGIGIEKDQLADLFNTYKQANHAIQHKYGGSGLGLAICKRLVELMHGMITVDSTPGKGTEFTVYLPIETPEKPEDNIKQPYPFSLSGKKVLIVDDNDTNRKILINQVSFWRMEPFETGDPYEALSWIDKGLTFDIALLDMKMPGLDGVTLAQMIRHRGLKEEFPIILMSSVSLTLRKEQHLFIDRKLTKPVRHTKLQSTLMSLLDSPTANSRVSTDQKKTEPSEVTTDVLLIEDDEINARAFRSLLKILGYPCDYANDGKSALEKLEERDYKVILSDINLPDMSGVDLMETIRATHPTYESKIVAFTAHALLGDEEKFLSQGFDSYLSKPFTRETARNLLEKLISQ